MDVEVGKAYRVLQRAGIIVSPLSPQMSFDELEAGYGDLLRHWLENQGFHCAVIPVASLEAMTTNTAADNYLEKYLKTNKYEKHFSRYIYHNLGTLGIPASNDVNATMASFLSNFTPKNLEDCIRNPIFVANHPPDKLLLFFVQAVNASPHSGAGAYNNIVAAAYSYQLLSPEDLIQREERQKKEKEKAAKAEEKKKKKKEEKERALLEKLKAKFET